MSPGNNVPCINVRERTGASSTARTERKLDVALGLTSLSAVKCVACGGLVEFETNGLGRSLERCLVCGHVRPLTAPAVRPDGEDYASRAPGGPQRRNEPRRHPETTTDPHVQLLRATQAARALAPIDPALLDAKREFDALEERIRAARKGGRPPGPKLAVGRRFAVDLSDAPGRPDRLPLPPHAPPLPLPPRAEPTMPKGIPTNGYQKKCERSGRAFIGAGTRSRYCGECDQCLAATAGDATPPRAPKKSATKAKAETKPKRVETGVRGEPRKGISSPASGAYRDTIEQMQREADALEERRTRLLEAIDHLQALGRPA